MTTNLNAYTNIELLAPAGDLEKLKFALHYGADAVYIGGEIFGLRVASKNFTHEDMVEGVAFAHERNKKVYLTLNIIPHNEDINELDTYLEDIKDIPFDAYILSDPGTFAAVKSLRPDMEIHLSTQANTTNYRSAAFWHQQGVARVILARELSLEEITSIRAKTPSTLEIEAFVHGAMCISYSGRCLISNYMAGRDANKGACAHPCRWEYSLVEETRPGEYFPIVEDESGTYFFNSKDLCMIEHIPELVKSGLTSLKIEGRVKTAYYVATVVRAYRAALDHFLKEGEGYVYNPEWLEEIKKASHRDFTTGFYFDKPGHEEQHYLNSSYIRGYDFIGIVKAYDPETGMAKVEQRNKMSLGETIEIIGPDEKLIPITLEALFDEQMNPIDSAPHAQQIIYIPVPTAVNEMDILRKRKDETHE